MHGNGPAVKTTPSPLPSNREAKYQISSSQVLCTIFDITDSHYRVKATLLLLRTGWVVCICTKCWPSKFTFNISIRTSSKASPVLHFTTLTSNEITEWHQMCSSDISCFDKTHHSRPLPTVLLQQAWHGKPFQFCRKQSANKIVTVAPLR